MVTVVSTDRVAITPERRSGGARAWQRRYALGLFVTDALALVWVVIGTQIGWLGAHSGADVSVAGGNVMLSYTTFSVFLVLGWLAALALRDTRDPRIITVGWEEYRRVVEASVRFFGIVAIVAVIFQINLSRGYLLISLPAGVLVLLATRWLWRQWVNVQRAQGLYLSRVLLVGTPEASAHFARELERVRWAGYLPVGACVPVGTDPAALADEGIEVFGSFDDIERVVQARDVDTVLVTGSDLMPPGKVREISWMLEQGRRHLAVAPTIADVAGPRIRMRPAAGAPLIHVETPRFSYGQRFVKRAADIVVSALAIVGLSPLLIALAVIVKATSKGPILFRQTRVGRKGREFKMLKFRSMVVDAEAQLAALKAMADAGNDVMFKMREDPRVTRVGRVMRRYSLDELPQLFNVLCGQMSLVGPRPPLPSEVVEYADHVHRRFLVQPGITGLWQVSGRSTLSWEETVRLDLSYVDNWSLVGDLIIVLKTGRAVLAPGDTAA
ncbi:exopolysaccharide biosynthesis polyprenyl glycosylphosphotransferase [Microbacterium sp. ZXX196]|nr:sugar transferase [Microbacterium sp. ZXX196]MTE23292.1 exopolysaccharide biosynthesis polyprenyl glycosylphosphotransferase [Microbacterium sp. ZXX196]